MDAIVTKLKKLAVNCFHTNPVLPNLLIIKEKLKNLILIWNNSNWKAHCNELNEFKKNIRNRAAQRNHFPGLALVSTEEVVMSIVEPSVWSADLFPVGMFQKLAWTTSLSLSTQPRNYFPHSIYLILLGVRLLWVQNFTYDVRTFNARRVFLHPSFSIDFTL